MTFEEMKKIEKPMYRARRVYRLRAGSFATRARSEKQMITAMYRGTSGPLVLLNGTEASGMIIITAPTVKSRASMCRLYASMASLFEAANVRYSALFLKGSVTGTLS